MMMRTLGIGALAAAASAIMLPPTLNTISDTNGLETLGGIDPFSALLEINCPGCSYANPDDKGSYTWTKGVENSLFVNISVSSNPETLEFNGVQFYPPLMPLTASLESPYIIQAPSNTTLREVRTNSGKFSKLRLTGWSFIRGKTQVNEAGEEILTIHLSMKAVEQKPIKVDDIAITALKNKQAHLMLLKTELETRPSPSKECQNWPLLCQWRATLNAKLEQMRGRFRGKCHKRPLGAKPGIAEHMEDENRPHGHYGHGRPRPHHKSHHHKGHRHGSHHKTLNKVAGFLLAVVIPLLIGTLVGMLVYAVGLILGSFIALLWVRLRGRRSGYSRVTLEDVEEAAEEPVDEASEKEVVYFDAPPDYIEVEGKEVRRT